MRFLSLFSGIEAASVAWSPLGWSPVAFAEVSPFCSALLAARYPGVPNLGDVSQIDERALESLGPFEVLVGGSPCQDLSRGGNRAGLLGARSALFVEQMRIFNHARRINGTRFLVWENVPGAFHTNRGRDFAFVVNAMAGARIGVPRDGWQSEGVALGRDGLVEWGVLNAEWFGVAQRRERVFACLDVGDWQRRPPVLLEPDRVRGNCPTRGGEILGNTGTARDGYSLPCFWNGEQVTQTLDAVLHKGQTLPEKNRFPCVVVADESQPGGMAARKLTPREVERLFGFPDDYTLVPYRGALAKDGPRYHALGNSIAVPVLHWVGKQIDEAVKYANR